MPLNSATALRQQARCSRAQMNFLPRARAKSGPSGYRLLSALMALSVPLVGVLAAIGISRFA